VGDILRDSVKEPQYWNVAAGQIGWNPGFAASSWGIWLGLLLVLPTLVIFELSLVPGIRPGMVNSIGLNNYVQVFQPIYLQVIGLSSLQ